MSAKKITKIGGEDQPVNPSSSNAPKYAPSNEEKSKAKTLRIVAAISFLVAIGCEVFAIIMLQKPVVSTVWLIVLIVLDLIFAVVGSYLWKMSNQLDPASEKDKVRFFVQNQLGLIMAVIAFLPLVILIFTNKNLSGKQKGIVGSIAVAAMVIAGLAGFDFDPPSQEKYQEEIDQNYEENVDANNTYDGTDVFWTKSGKSYHLYSDCSYINGVRTEEIFQGSISQAEELKNITDICDRCDGRKQKEEESVLDEVVESVD